MNDTHLLLIGKIIGAHGVNGVVKVFSYAESSSRFVSGLMLHIRGDEGAEKTVKIKWAKPHTRAILLSLEGITNRDQADALLNTDLFISRELLEEPEAGAFYWSDLLGLSVFDMADEYIGRVTSIIETGSNDVYVVTYRRKGQHKEVLVPALEWVVKEIDLGKKMMRIDLPEGL